MIRVEPGDELTAGERERVVEVAGLRAVSIRTPDVGRAVPRGDGFDGGITRVVQDVDAHAGATHRARGGDRPLDDGGALATGRDQHVHVEVRREPGRVQTRTASRARPPEADGLDEVED